MEKQSYELVKTIEKEHTVYKVIYDSSQENLVYFFWQLKSRVKKILHAHPDIDIIHLNDGLMGYFGLWLQSYTKTPVVVTFHGLDIVFPNKLFQNKVVPKLRSYAGAISVSEATAQACIERQFPAEKVFVVPNGVDHDIASLPVNEKKVKVDFLNKFGIQLAERKVIVSIGRPVRRKGFSWFIEQVLPKLSDDVLFVMIGPRSKNKKQALWRSILPKSWVHEIDLFWGASSDEDTLNKLAKRPEFSKKLIQTGSIPYQEVMGLLSLADLFVMPNIKVPGDAEGFGLVALEASLRQTTVLASDLEGITEAIKNDKNGYLLPPGDEQAWANKIEELLSDSNKLAQKSKNFKAFTLHNFSWKKMANGYLKVFEQIL